MKKKVMLDHYEVLGLPTGKQGTKLTQQEITKAYRAKALQLHPDKRPHDPNANAEFQTLCSSYQLLLDPKSRKLFDASLPKPKTKPKPKPKTKTKINITRLDPEDFPPGDFWTRIPKPNRESPEPKREPPKPQPKPDNQPPNAPKGIDDDVKSWLIGCLITGIAPMVHPAARNLGSVFIGFMLYTIGHDIATRREESEWKELWLGMVAVCRFFKGLVIKRNPPPQNQESQEQDNADIEDWVMV